MTQLTVPSGIAVGAPPCGRQLQLRRRTSFKEISASELPLLPETSQSEGRRRRRVHGRPGARAFRQLCSVLVWLAHGDA